MNLNPFTYGRPIDTPERFIGRQREIEQVYSRLLSACESSAIVGESRIGKTSLLKTIAHPTTQAVFGIDPDHYIFVYQDLQFLDSRTTPTRFWHRVLRPCRRALKTHEEVTEEINQALQSENIDNYTLDDIFTLIDDADLRVVLLLDEFEKVTKNPQFDNDFFAGLRALAIHHNLALVTSSRNDLVDLTHSAELRSSPFFNIFATINLRSFSEAETTELVDSYLKDTDVKFLPSELNIVFAVAGYHPYFLQLACYHLFAAHLTDLDDEARRRYLMEQTRAESAPLFQNIWHDSTTSQQILLTLMTMRELEKVGDSTTKDMERFYSRASQVMPELESRALVIKNLDTSAYHLFSTELREWIADEIVGSTDDLRAWRNWQKDETLIGVLPVSLQDMLANVVRGLNPDYQDMFSNFLLDPSTALPALQLVQNFVTRYEDYKQKRPERDPAVALANEKAAVGDTPPGLFALVSQQLAEREKQGGQIKPQEAPKEPSPTSTGRTLRRLQKKPVSAVAVSGLIISSIITKLDLEASDAAFVNDELKWLFQATDNLLKVCRQEADRNTPVALDIPPDAEKLREANNKLLRHLADDDIGSWKDFVETRLEWVNARRRELDMLLNEEASRGSAGKSDIDLQNKLRDKRIEIMSIVEELAQLMEQAYGIFVTSPGQIVEVLKDQ